MSGEKQSESQSESESEEEGPGGLVGLIAGLSGVILKKEILINWFLYNKIDIRAMKDQMSER